MHGRDAVYAGSARQNANLNVVISLIRRYIVVKIKGACMKSDYSVIIIGLVILLLCVSGCTSTKPPASPISQSPQPQPAMSQPAPDSTVSTIEPAEMALQLSDVPAGFTIHEKWERTRSDVLQSASDRGWIKGYHVMFRRQNESTLQVEYLTQDIDVYLTDNVNQALAKGNAEILQGSEDTYEVIQLPDPEIGDSSQAYDMKLIKRSNRVLASGLFIQFVKKDVYEQIVMVSMSQDYKTLKKIADIAAGKIT
jgi:hypothetical protein